MEKSSKIMDKIRALMAKTVDNGATEAEMHSAMEKASELMRKHYIEKFEANEDIGFNEISVKQNSTHRFWIIANALDQIFQCECYNYRQYLQAGSNKHEKYFVVLGLGEDPEIWAFFYSQLVNLCLNAKDSYKKSPQYKKMSALYTPKTALNSFVEGVISGLITKMRMMYGAQKYGEYGIVLAKKSELVRSEFDSRNPFLKNGRKSTVKISSMAQDDGLRAAEKIHISMGVNEKTTDTIYSIN